MDIATGFSLGFCDTALATAMIVPAMLHFLQLGYGKKRGLPTLMISAASFDTLHAFIMFGICSGVSVSKEIAKVSGK